MMRATSILPLAIGLGLAGCASDEKYIVVTVDARAAVRDVATLRVTLSNAGSMRTEDLPIGGASFPATFSVSPEDRTGELGITIEAFDDESMLVGQGAAQSTIELATAQVLLEPTDFVVNTDYPGDQEIANYFSGSGFQVAASPNGTWTVAYNVPCTDGCNVRGRRFDTSGRPVNSTIAAGTGDFSFSTRLTTSLFGVPAVAANATGSIAVWNNQAPGTTAPYSIECRALDPAGAAISAQVQVTTDDFPDIVSAVPLPNGNYAIAFDSRVTNRVIRNAIIRPDCGLVGVVGTVYPNAATTLPRRSHLAANATNILYAWILDGSVYARVGRHDGSFVAAEAVIIPKVATPADDVEYVRVVPLGGGVGFGVIVRWEQTSGISRLELYRVSNAGAVMGPPLPVSSRTGTDFKSSESFGVAPAPDGSFLVVWHACADRGDGNGCGVFGRLFRPTGEGGPELSIPTTTINDQVRPSAAALPGGAFAVAWTDRSGAAPDPAGAAVRARIIYPAGGTSTAFAP